MTQPANPKARRSHWRSLITAAGLLGVLMALALSPSGAPVLSWLSDMFAPRPAVGGPFSLVDQTGARRTESDFAGKPMLLFFGFTHCPDVCPTTLTSVSRWLEALGPDGPNLAAIFVTVDPERDTPAVLADYLKAFDSRIVGLTGTPGEVSQMLRLYHVYARKTEAGDFEHTASLYLIGRDGALAQLLKHDDGDETAVAALRQAVNS